MRDEQPQLLITDIRMPGCDGIELIRRAKELQPDLHFIVISGYRQFEYAQSALKYGVEDYLLKPLKQEELSGIFAAHQGQAGRKGCARTSAEKEQRKAKQERFIAALRQAADRQQPFLSAAQAEEEYGLHFSTGLLFCRGGQAGYIQCRAVSGRLSADDAALA